MIPRFIKAFENTRYQLPMELWLMIEDVLKRDIKFRARQLEALFIIYEQLDHDDYTERLFQMPAKISRLLAWPANDDKGRRVLIMYYDFYNSISDRENGLRHIINQVYRELDLYLL